MDSQSKEHVKVLFRTEQVDGYPPEEWEGIWALPEGNGTYLLDNIPFFALGVSCGDIVSAKKSDTGELEFDKVLRPSTNSTVRVVVYDEAETDTVRKSLVEFGCSVEGTGIAGLLAINIPRESLNDTLEYLRERHLADALDYEEATLRPS